MIKCLENIPEKWKVGRVKDIFYISKEKAHQKDPVILSLARDGIKVRDISNNEGQIAESYENYNPVKPGDLLLNPMDLYSGANCNMSLVEGVISPAYVNLRKKYADVYPRFYDYYFKVQYWTMNMFAHGKGVSFDNRWTLNTEGVLNFEIPIPSGEEQQEIAEFLDKKCSQIERLIKLQDDAISKLKAFKQTIISEVVNHGLNYKGKLKNSEIEWIGQIPEHWEIARLKNFGWFMSGIANKKPEDFGHGYPFVNYRNVSRNFVIDVNCEEKVNSTEADREKYNILYGDLFFTGSSETVDELGFSSVAMQNFQDAVWNGFCIRMRPYSFKNYNPKYFLYLTRSNLARNYLNANDNSITRANLSQSRLGNLPLVIPPLEEQDLAVIYLDKKCNYIENLIKAKEEKIIKLQEYKKSLIYECVTGKKEI